MSRTKQLVVLNGTMGVGKSATAQALRDHLQPCLYLDGDWCWAMSPFEPSDEDKQMVLENTTFLLRRFLQDSTRDYVIFTWVLHSDLIWQQIRNGLEGLDFQLHRFTLTCDEQALRDRLTRDVVSGQRTIDVVERSIARLAQFSTLETAKLDVSHIDARTAAKRIAEQMHRPRRGIGLH